MRYSRCQINILIYAHVFSDGAKKKTEKTRIDNERNAILIFFSPFLFALLIDIKDHGCLRVQSYYEFFSK